MRYRAFLVSLAGSLAIAAPLVAQSQPPKVPSPVVDPFKDPPAKQPPSKEPKDRPQERERERTDEPQSNKVDLRPRFEKGQVIKFRMDLNQRSRTLIRALDEKPTESKSTQQLDLVFKVKDATDAGSVVELSFGRIKMTKESEDTKESFDSAQPPSKDSSNSLGPSLRALADTTLTVHLDPDGNVTNIEGGEQLMSLEAFGTDPSALPGGLPAQPSGAGSGGGSFQQALGSIFNIKKGSGLVSVGEEWTNADTLDSGLLGKFKISSTHKLRSHAAGDAKVSVRGHIEPDSAAPGAGLVKITDSSFVGDYSWDTRQRMLRKMDMHQHVVLEAALGGGMTLTSDMKSVVTRTN